MSHALWNSMGLTGKRAIIVHHDDLGSLHAQNRAWYSLDLPTGSVMMPCAWAPQVIRHARADADLGVHLTLTSEWNYPRWHPLTPGASLRDEQGYFWATNEAAWQHILVEEAEAELRAQVEMALGLGLDITHLDTHMGTVLRPDVFQVYLQLGLEYGLPLLLPESAQNAPIPEDLQATLQRQIEASRLPKVRFASLYGADINAGWSNAYINTLSRLGPGVHHFLHHAAAADEEGRALPDWENRSGDLEALSDPAVRKILAEFTWVTYREIRDAMRRHLA
jgi:chitin disaccharide deacetylase